ncbi:MAG: biotin/lipoyl-containing protein [Anaerolineae bacterium]
MNTYEIIVNGTTYLIELGEVSYSPIQVTVNGEVKTVSFREVKPDVQPKSIPTAAVVTKPVTAPAPKVSPAAVAGTKINAPMPGKILSITVKVGDQIKEGDTVCTLEAMKMEMPISSTAAGTVKAIHIAVGDNVANNDPLVSIA